MNFDGIYNGVALSIDKNVIFKNFGAMKILKNFVHSPFVLFTSTQSVGSLISVNLLILYHIIQLIFMWYRIANGTRLCGLTTGTASSHGVNL